MYFFINYILFNVYYGKCKKETVKKSKLWWVRGWWVLAFLYFILFSLLEKGLMALSSNINRLSTGVVTTYALYVLVGLIFFIILPCVAVLITV